MTTSQISSSSSRLVTSDGTEIRRISKPAPVVAAPPTSSRPHLVQTTLFGHVKLIPAAEKARGQAATVSKPRNLPLSVEDEERGYTCNESTLLQPSLVHTESDIPGLDLWIGAMWSVRADALSAAEITSHLQDLQCMPDIKGGPARARAAGRGRGRGRGSARACGRGRGRGRGGLLRGSDGTAASAPTTKTPTKRPRNASRTDDTTSSASASSDSDSDSDGDGDSDSDSDGDSDSDSDGDSDSDSDGDGESSSSINGYGVGKHDIVGDSTGNGRCERSAEPSRARPVASESSTCAERTEELVLIDGAYALGEVANGRLYMPAWYGQLAFPNIVPTRTLLTAGDTIRDGIRFRGQLRRHPPQQQATVRYMEWVTKNLNCSSCIVSLPCGYGKTVWFLHLVAHLKRVTLVFAHTIALVDQWIEEARQFLPGIQVGYVKDGKRRVKGMDMIVCSIQSVFSHIEARKSYVQRMFRRVGVVCVDEGHHVVARTFWGVMSQCPALTRVVLTATPRRKDGLMDQLQWIAGPVIFRAIRKVDDVRVVCVEYVNDEHVELLGYGGMLNSAEMVNRLCADGARTAIAVDIAACLAITQGRRVVVVTPRVAHVTEVAALLEARLVAAGVAQRNVALRVDEPFPGKKPRRKKSMTRAERKTYRHALRAFERAKNAWEDDGTHWHMETFTCPLVGVVKRGMKALPRQIQFEGVAVVATSDIMEEGVSYKAWDTLVDLDNSSDAEQVVGRILRECPGKKVPLVVDVWINMSYFGHLFWKRHKHYVEQRFNIVRMQAKSVADVAVSHVWDCYNAPATYVNGV